MCRVSWQCPDCPNSPCPLFVRLFSSYVGHVSVCQVDRWSSSLAVHPPVRQAVCKLVHTLASSSTCLSVSSALPRVIHQFVSLSPGPTAKLVHTLVRFSTCLSGSSTRPRLVELSISLFAGPPVCQIIHQLISQFVSSSTCIAPLVCPLVALK